MSIDENATLIFKNIFYTACLICVHVCCVNVGVGGHGTVVCGVRGQLWVLVLTFLETLSLALTTV